MMAFEMFDTSHESLVDLGAKIAVGMGYTKVIKEYSISIPTCFQKKTGQTQYRVDVFAENDKGETLAIECGHLHSVYGKDTG